MADSGSDEATAVARPRFQPFARFRNPAPAAPGSPEGSGPAPANASGTDSGSDENRPKFQPFARVRNTWSNLEKNHFDGNFIASVAAAPRLVAERASRLGEELGTAAAGLYEEAQGRGPDGQPLDDGLWAGTPTIMEEGTSMASTAPPPQQQQQQTSMQPLQQLHQQLLVTHQSPPGSPLRSQVSPAVTPPQRSPQKEPHEAPGSPVADLLKKRQELQDELDTERAMRRGRISALSTLEEDIRKLRQELVEERASLAKAEESSMVAQSRLESLERAAEELQEEHERWQGKKADLDVQLRRSSDMAAAKARAERQATREGAWAREGPETEALLAAKMELAELLTSADEARLKARREQAQLTRDIEAAREEQARLLEEQQNREAQRTGLWKLFGAPRRQSR